MLRITIRELATNLEANPRLRMLVIAILAFTFAFMVEGSAVLIYIDELIEWMH
jgi:hypothetical protein